MGEADTLVQTHGDRVALADGEHQSKATRFRRSGQKRFQHSPAETGFSCVLCDADDDLVQRFAGRLFAL
ncbi:MAG TPA: hypothetical protein VGV36_05935 [Solirubrobacteraceae bacterium]|nr:hypothetical protein [Solirubrobacteraceae bacterium]